MNEGLNINSPLVQQMLANTPGGIGNIPVYNGPPPTIERGYVANGMQVPQQVQSYYPPGGFVQPNPTPMQMVEQNQHMSYLEPNSYNPYLLERNTMQQQQQPFGYYPGYNSGYQYQQPPNYFGFNHPSFYGYYNPYIGQQGQYPGYGMTQQQPAYIDQEIIDIMNQARSNGISYEEQVRMNSTLYKQMARICCASLGKSKEETEECVRQFDIRVKEPVKSPAQIRQEYLDSVVVKPFTITIKRGDEVVYTNKDNYRCENYARFNYQIDCLPYLEEQARRNRMAKDMMNKYMYDHAVEREMDNCGSLMEFFNEHAWKLTYTSKIREQQAQRAKVNQLYNQNAFRARLEADRAKFAATKDVGYMERFLNRIPASSSDSRIRSLTVVADDSRTTDPRVVSDSGRYIRGRNGVLPDGTKMSDNIDPTIAEAFTLDTETGKLRIDAPPWMKQNHGYPLDEMDMKLLAAEDAFVESIDKKVKPT